MPLDCVTVDRSLYGIVEVLDGFTPATEQVFFFELTAEQG
jgi:hypothetical protein